MRLSLATIITPKKDNAVLIVGRKKKGQAVDIINAFQGSEATKLYNKLITAKNKED